MLWVWAEEVAEKQNEAMRCRSWKRLNSKSRDAFSNHQQGEKCGCALCLFMYRKSPAHLHVAANVEQDTQELGGGAVWSVGPEKFWSSYRSEMCNVREPEQSGHDICLVIKAMNCTSTTATDTHSTRRPGLPLHLCSLLAV